MSELVGDTGRVYAFELVPRTFAMLVRSIAARGVRKVTAAILACDDDSRVLTISIPDDPLSGEDFYHANISEAGASLTAVVRGRTDDLGLPVDRFRLVKIDAEGHDSEVNAGIRGLIEKTRRLLIVEHPPNVVDTRLMALDCNIGFSSGSPNGVLRAHDPATT
jgi:FkbM family methyltransferase